MRTAADEDGIRWRDGDNTLNAAEWAFLQQKAKDLPRKAQHYYWTGYTEKGVKGASFQFSGAWLHDLKRIDDRLLHVPAHDDRAVCVRAFHWRKPGSQFTAVLH